MRPVEPFPSAAPPPPLPPPPSKYPPRSQNELSLGTHSIFKQRAPYLVCACPGSCQFFFGKAARSSFKTAKTPKGAALPTCKNPGPARSAQNGLKFGGDLPRLLGNTPSKGFCSSSNGAALAAVSVGGASPPLPPSLSKCPPRSQNDLSPFASPSLKQRAPYLVCACPGSCQFFFGKAAHSSFKTAQTPKGAALPTCKNPGPARSAQNELKLVGDLPRLLGNTPSKGF